MVFLMGFFGQMSGNGLGYFNVSLIYDFRSQVLTSVYLPLLPQLSIYEALGFDKQMQFNMNLISTCCAAAAAWFAVSLEDRMPRRGVLVWGTAMCSVLLAANAGFSAAWASYVNGKENLSVGRAGAAFVCT